MDSQFLCKELWTFGGKDKKVFSKVLEYAGTVGVSHPSNGAFGDIVWNNVAIVVSFL